MEQVSPKSQSNKGFFIAMVEGLLENGIWSIQLTKKHLPCGGGGAPFKYKEEKPWIGRCSFQIQRRKTLDWSPKTFTFMFYSGQGPLVGDISEMTQPPPHAPYFGNAPPWGPSNTLAFWTSASCALGNKHVMTQVFRITKYVSSCKDAVVSIWPFLPLFVSLLTRYNGHFFLDRPDPRNCFKVYLQHIGAKSACPLCRS